MNTKRVLCATAILIGALTGPPALAQNVKITPLGSHDGELCPFDRALIFEDPDGTRLLYDPGRTVRGGSDPRLGQIDAILLSHVHADHLGDEHQAAANAGTCARPEMAVKDTPNSNTVNVALVKRAPIVAGGEMHFFLQSKVKALGGDPAKLVRLVRYGATTSFGKVVVTSVPASHTNGLSPAFLEKEHAQALAAAGLTVYVGPAGKRMHGTGNAAGARPVSRRSVLALSGALACQPRGPGVHTSWGVWSGSPRCQAGCVRNETAVGASSASSSGREAGSGPALAQSVSSTPSTAPPEVLDSTTTARRVLLLYADPRLTPAFVAIDGIVRATLESRSPVPVSFYTEYLDPP
jgi:glyoxylase-like metal-dependent hydrolase (beta-lactamase superfamily II)